MVRSQCGQVTDKALGAEAGAAAFECLHFVPQQPEHLVCKRRDGRLCKLLVRHCAQPEVMASWRVHTQPAGPLRFSQRVMFGCTSDGHYAACGALPPLLPGLRMRRYKRNKSAVAQAMLNAPFACRAVR